MEKLNHRDRIQAVIEGERPDRFAASFWRHFFHKEHYAEGTAEAMIDFQKHFDWDFVKINPRADYHVQDWGVELRYSHDEFKKHAKVDFPVKAPDDWTRIQALPLDSPALAEHLKVISLIRKGVGREVPILMTLFTPLSVAGRMVKEQQTLIDHIRQRPESVHHALENIKDTLIRFAEEARNAGADGLFYATTQWASSDMLSWAEYREFGLKYDLAPVQATGGDALNLLHVCASNNFLQELVEQDHNCRLLNWDTSDPTNMPLDKAEESITSMALVGGVDHKGWLQHSDPGEIEGQMQNLRKAHNPARVIIGPGCSLPPETPIANLEQVRKGL
jgi:uroporphyrinogen decarboxylase